MSTAQSASQALAATIGRLMNGEALPHPTSTEFRLLMVHIETFLRDGTYSDQAEFGCLALAQLIASGSAHVKTTQVLSELGGLE